MVGEVLDLPVSPLKVPTKAQLNLFHRSKKEKDGPTLDELLLDLDSNGMASLWNKRACLLLASRFIASPEYSCKDLRTVVKALTAHLASLKGQYQTSCLESMLEGREEQVLQKTTLKTLKARKNRRRSVRVSRF